MKKASILRSVVIMVLLLTGVTVLGFRPNGYTVKCYIKANPGTVFYLYYQYEGKQLKDSVILSSSDQFEFKGNLPEPVICTLSNSLNRQIKLFVGENSDISVSGTLEKFYNVEVTGSAEDLLYNGFKQKMSVISGEYRAMVKASGADLHDKKSQPSIKFHERLDSLTYSFVKENNSSTAAALAIFDCYLTNPDRPNAKLCYGLLSSKGRQSGYAKRIQQFVNAIVDISPGHPAPDFELMDVNGKLQKLNDFKGKYILLDFWASWCAPCRKEHPNLIQAYHKYGGDTLKFIGLSMDASDLSWKQAIKVDGLEWIQLNDPKSMNGSVAESYGVKAIPFNCIVDPKGIIQAVNLRGDVLNKYLAIHFKANH